MVFDKQLNGEISIEKSEYLKHRLISYEQKIVVTLVPGSYFLMQSWGIQSIMEDEDSTI